MKFVPISLLVICQVCFTWSIISFFKAPAKPTRGMNGIKLFGIIFFVLHALSIYLWPADATLLLSSTVLYTASLILFWWCIAVNSTKPLTLAYTNDEPNHLIRTGPYRYIRHPFYTSYTLYWMAGCLATSNYLLFVSVIIMLAFYYQSAIFEEDKFFRSNLKPEYENYKNQTKMFVPKCF